MIAKRCSLLLHLKRVLDSRGAVGPTFQDAPKFNLNV